MDEKACRKCGLIISHGGTCPLCNSSELTNKWNGYIIMLNAEKSELAKLLSIKVNSTYAINMA
jgi:DNA-directed RNA polymerase subunit E"